jgi:hypothetical protein
MLNIHKNSLNGKSLFPDLTNIANKYYENCFQAKILKYFCISTGSVFV